MNGDPRPCPEPPASRPHPPASRARPALLALLALLVVLAVGGALGRRGEPVAERCGEGFVALGPRCCGQGQRLDEAQRCVGAATLCGGGLRASAQGCEAPDERIAVRAGAVTVGPSDWEAQGVIAARRVEVSALWLDRYEATEARWARCAAAGACPGRSGGTEAGRAATMSLAEAEVLCRWAGGRLPTDDEWTVAAMGPGARRYPWGDTGAVCRRAAYGLVHGPCAQGARGPDTVGAHPAGQGVDGQADLAGNVAEWVRGPAGARRRGGSFRTTLAAELRGWNGRDAPAGEDDGATGVRCAYDAP